GEISHEASEAPQGVLRMTAPITAGRVFLSRWLAHFSQRYSKIQLFVDFTDAEANLVEQRYDLAMRVGELQSSTLVSRPLAKTSRILCVSTGCKNVDNIQSVDDLSEWPKIAFKSNRDGPNRWRLFDKQQNIDLTFQPHAVLSDMTALLEMAKAGGGIVLAPAFVVNPYLAEGSLQQILPYVRGEDALFHLVYLKRDNLPRKTRLLIDFLMNCAQREPALFATFHPM
ncbi:substrate binding domain-containing protein, partial [Kaarinaea lacus]